MTQFCNILFKHYFRLKKEVKFKSLTSTVHTSEKAIPGSACFDIFSARCVTLEPVVTKPIEIDIGFKLSKKYVCRLYPLSGLSLKSVTLVGRGLLDSDFRWIICVILTNLSQRVIEIETRKVIAQVLFVRKEEAKFVEVDELDKAEHGVKGFSSTGK